MMASNSWKVWGREGGRERREKEEKIFSQKPREEENRK
jgi:hypothetical protein